MLSMASDIGWLLAGMALLYAGGELLVGGASRLALRANVSPLTVGLTVVAFGTSAPELVVSLNAVAAGMNDIAVGNVVGSNICNVLLVLGATALVRPIAIHVKLLRLDVPLLVACSLLLPLLLVDDRLSRPEAVAMLVMLAAYVGFNLWEARRERPDLEAAGLIEDGSSSGASAWAGDAARIVAGLAGLVAGSDCFVDGAVGIAGSLGISQAVIGLTVVAVGTSLPELATSILAALRGRSDLAIGNVVGSNVFNILCILGTAGTVHPLTRGGVGWTDLGVMAGSAVLLVPLILSGMVLGRGEGLLGLVAYFVYVFVCLGATAVVA
jgi:cation:H+ antiporter